MIDEALIQKKKRNAGEMKRSKGGRDLSRKKRLNRTHKSAEFLWIDSSIGIDISVIEHRTSWIVLITFSCHIRRTNTNIRANTVDMATIGIGSLSVFFIFDWIWCETSDGNVETNFVGYRLCGSTTACLKKKISIR